MAEPFIAEIKIFAGTFAPRGYAFCNGQLLPISQNTALFSLIGTTYGGDGRTTTALPNLQGRAAMHPGTGPGLTTKRLGERAGVKVVALTEAQFPNHNHAVQATSAEADEDNPAANLVLAATSGIGPYKASGGAPTTMSSQAVGSIGGGQAHNNLQPYLGLNFIIALTGLYPSRS